jgi:putative transposase
VDIGIANLTATSDGDLLRGEDSRNVRKRFKHLRDKLQRVGTKSAKRQPKKISMIESLNKNHKNHCISKAIVLGAKGTNRAIALEDLNGIRSVESVSKRRREERDHWAFYQLQTVIQYKAKIAGVPVVYVDSHDTSMICSECGCWVPENRVKNQFR